MPDQTMLEGGQWAFRLLFPLAVLDADWARVQARKTASGDTIFV